MKPEEFESLVAQAIIQLGGNLSSLMVERREKIASADGEYEVDVSARFEALGAAFLVLIECKHQAAPIKRFVVQVLYDRIRSLGAQKGMLFSTSPFQAGAVRYAATHGIALVYVANDQLIFEAKKVQGRRRDLMRVAAMRVPFLRRTSRRAVEYQALTEIGLAGLLDYGGAPLPTGML